MTFELRWLEILTDEGNGCNYKVLIFVEGFDSMDQLLNREGI